MLGIPTQLSDTPGNVVTALPRYGERSRSVLLELGFSERAIRELMELKVTSEPASETGPAPSQGRH